MHTHVCTLVIKYIYVPTNVANPVLATSQFTILRTTYTLTYMHEGTCIWHIHGSILYIICSHMNIDSTLFEHTQRSAHTFM